MHFNLTNEIIKLSISKYWEEAKLEWRFEQAYQSQEPQTCLCGHYPIKNICVIRNVKNETKTEVGNCCVNKFMDIDDGNKIFDSIRRLKADMFKSISVEAIEYLYDKKILSEFEYNFYKDTLRKRALTEKQLDIRKSINQKFLDFTSGEFNANIAKISNVMRWANDRKDFDVSFVVSLKMSCERNGKLTEKQLQGLENVIKKWKIE